MNELLIHIGYPKTGTTLLQEKIFPNLSSIEYFGKKSGTENKIYDNFYSYVFSKDDRFIGDIRCFFMSRLPFKNILISEEDFLFNSLRFSETQSSYNYLYSLQRVQSLFADTEVKIKIIVTKRAFLDLIRSIYSQSYTNYFSLYSETKTFEQFTNNLLKLSSKEKKNSNWYNTVNTLQLNRLLSTLKINFGHGNIIVNDYSNFVDSPNQFVLNFFGTKFFSKSDVEFILNYNFQTKLNSRSTLHSKEYLINDNQLFNRLIAIKNKYLPNVKVEQTWIKPIIKKVQIGKKKTINLELSKEKETQLESKFYK
jgi:hypothetical protein